MRYPGHWRVRSEEWTTYESCRAEAATCKTCGGECGHFFTQAKDGPTSTATYWRVGDDGRCIASHLEREEDARLIAQAPILRWLVDLLVQEDPMYSPDVECDYRMCHFCDAAEDRIADGPAFVPHSRDCLWRRAKETLWSKAKEDD